jgi:hypothetical protein
MCSLNIERVLLHTDQDKQAHPQHTSLPRTRSLTIECVLSDQDKQAHPQHTSLARTIECVLLL